MYMETVLDLGVQLMINGGKNKSVAFIILFSIFLHMARSRHKCFGVHQKVILNAIFPRNKRRSMQRLSQK